MVFYRDVGVKTAAPFPSKLLIVGGFFTKETSAKFSWRIGWHLWPLRILLRFEPFIFVRPENMENFQHNETVEAGAEVETSNIPGWLVPVSCGCHLVTDFCITASLHPIYFYGSPGAWATSRRCRRRQCTSNGELPITRAVHKKLNNQTWQNQAFFERSHVDQNNVLKHLRLAAQQFFWRILGAFHPIQWAIITVCPFSSQHFKKKTELKNVRISPFHSCNASQCFLHESTSPNWFAPSAK